MIFFISFINLIFSNCIHDQFQKIPIQYSQNTRILNSQQSFLFHTFNIHFDTTNLKYLQNSHTHIYNSIIHSLQITQSIFRSTLLVDKQNYPILPSSISNSISNVISIPIHHFQNSTIFQPYDLVVYVGFRQEQIDYSAYSQSFILDPINNRPLFGYIIINVNAYQIDAIPKKNINTIIHELIHVLGFDKDLFSYWRDSNHSPHRHVIKKNSFFGQEQWSLVTPNLVSFAKTFYKCDQILGIPLENDGEIGSANSHFERTAFLNEIMTASNIPNLILSNFTLNLLKDTGWYIPQQNDDSFDFGKDGGCDFFDKSCSKNIQNKYFCKDKQIGIYGSHDMFGGCSSDIYSQCQYFEGLYDCKHRNDQNHHIKQVSDSSISIRQKFNNNEIFTCMMINCKGNNLYLIEKGFAYECKRNGQILQIQEKQIYCPNINSICQNERLQNCPCNDGICFNGNCYSNQINYQCDDNCQLCQINTNLTCIQCHQGYQLKNNQCVQNIKIIFNSFAYCISIIPIFILFN